MSNIFIREKPVEVYVSHLAPVPLLYLIRELNSHVASRLTTVYWLAK